MSRLIDADELLKSMDSRYKEKKNIIPDNLAEGFMQMEKLIKEQPTAYDVDKVIDELEKTMNRFNSLGLKGEVVGVVSAIEIVKAGGKNE